VIFNSGFGLLNGNFERNRVGKKVKDEARDKEDISFTPMAMPMLSGPGSISLLISLFAEYDSIEERGLIAGVVVFAGLVIFLILKSAPLLFRILGHSGIKAISRIMGFLVMAIAVEYIVGGIITLVSSY
jgi:multiple antibiotic resistance protein